MSYKPPAEHVQPLHSEAEEEMLQTLYAQLKPEAVQVYLQYFLARTPAHLQTDMQDLIKDDIAVPPEGGAQAVTDPNNLGAPAHQRVDVEAIAQAAGHNAGTEAAQAIRDEALANRTLNPGNPDKPLVNIETGETGPVIVDAGEAEQSVLPTESEYSQPRDDYGRTA